MLLSCQPVGRELEGERAVRTACDSGGDRIAERAVIYYKIRLYFK